MDSFVPQKTVRSNVLRNALKAYIVPAFASKYQIAAIRTLWSFEGLCESDSIWIKRREMQELLYRDNEVVAYFSCITALENRRKKRKRPQKQPAMTASFSSEESEDEDDEDDDNINMPGISFWIVFDWPAHALHGFEEKLTKLFMSSGLNLDSCKTIKGRGK